MDQLKLDPKRLNAERYVAVAVDRDKGSQNAVRWAADNLLMRGQSVTLIHVNQGYQSCPSPARSVGISKSSSSRSIKSGRSDIDDIERFDQSQDIFLPFCAYTSSKDISCDAVIIDDYDIVKALVEYVQLYRIETLVLGAASKYGITRIFNKHDIPTAVLKEVPDFCNVFVVSKEKVNFSKTALRPLRSLSLTATGLPVGRHNLITKENNNFKAATRTTRRVLHGPGEKIASLNIYSSMNARERGMIEALELNHEVSSLHAKNMKNPRKMRSQGGWISPIYDNSKSQSTKKLSKCLSIHSLDLKSNLEKVKSDDNDKRESSYIKTQEVKEKQLIPEESEALEEKMRLLELQMNQTMEMYHGACKEALEAKKKNKELQLLRKKDERKLAEAIMAKDEALAIAEKEKADRIEAIETAKVAQTKADVEASKRNTAEKELLELADETRMMLHSVDDSQAIVIYEENTCLIDKSEEDERKLSEALMAKEEALAIAEKEKAMRIEAIETAKVAQAKADEEAHKRNTAEKELLELADETRMMLHSIDDSQTILNPEENTCRHPMDKSEEGERKLAEALMAKEEALAIAEKEKAMRIVAIETANVAQTKADEEARKRNAAEKELLELADETRMILHSLDDSQPIVNCEKTTCGNSMVKSEKDAS